VLRYRYSDVGVPFTGIDMTKKKASKRKLKDLLKGKATRGMRRNELEQMAIKAKRYPKATKNPDGSSTTDGPSKDELIALLRGDS